MRYQLCGPVTGRDRAEAVAEFAVAADVLKDDVYDSCFVPTSAVDRRAGHEKAMRKCIDNLLSGTDVLVTLPGWESSQGASLEVEVARAIGVPVMTVEEVVACRANS